MPGVSFPMQQSVLPIAGLTWQQVCMGRANRQPRRRSRVYADLQWLLLGFPAHGLGGFCLFPGQM
jgi:hypothetical protein